MHPTLRFVVMITLCHSSKTSLTLVKVRCALIDTNSQLKKWVLCEYKLTI